MKCKCEKCYKKTPVRFSSWWSQPHAQKLVCKECYEALLKPLCCKDLGTDEHPKTCGAIAVMGFQWDPKIEKPHVPGYNWHFRCSNHRKYANTDGVTDLKDIIYYTPAPTNSIQKYVVPVEEVAEAEEFVPPKTIQETIEYIIRWCDKIEGSGQKRVLVSSLRDELLNMLSVMFPEVFDGETPSSTSTTPLPPPPPKKKDSQVVCPKCDEFAPFDVSLCPWCNHDFAVPELDSKPTFPPKPAVDLRNPLSAGP